VVTVQRSGETLMRWFVSRAAVVGVAVGALGCAKAERSAGAALAQSAAASASVPPIVSAAPALSGVPLYESKLAGAKDVQEALKLAAPDFRDSTEKPDPAGVAFAHWAASRVKYETLRDAEGVGGIYQLGEYIKDPDSKRGDRVIVAGRLGSIRVKRGDFGSLAIGHITVPMPNRGRETVYFNAVGSTDKVLAHDDVVFLGVGTGIYTYSNTGGGTTRAAFLVGSFARTPSGEPVRKMKVRNE
jgi:hypothetical protein